MFKTIFIVILALAVLAGVYFVIKPSPVAAPSPSVLPSPSASLGVEPAAKVIEITAKNFSFTPNEIRVKKGDKIKINLTVEDGFHNWKVDEFNAETERVGAGKTTSVEFVADKTGTFEYYCAVATHRQMGMTGKLIVE